MGQFRVTITGSGGHGCQREVLDGGTVFGCGHMGCPDCESREFVARLKAKGVNVEEARLEHWPGTPSMVEDDLLSKKRKGNFPKPR